MRRSVLLVGLLVALLGTGIRVSLWAQAPAAAPSASSVPALDDLEKAWLQNVILSQQLANSACQALDSVKQYQSIRTDVQTKIETKRPGWTLDWATGLLMAKAPPVVTK